MLVAAQACSHGGGIRSDRATASTTAATQETPAIEHRTLTLDDGSVLRYGLLLQRGSSDRTGPLPLVLVLHYGAPGDVTPPYYGDGILERLVRPALGTLSAVFVAPDAPGRGWADPRSERAVLALLDHLRTSMKLDAHRTIVTGYSVGGMGVWYFVARHPELFRAAVPIASFPMLRDGRTAADRRSQLLAIGLDRAGSWTAPFLRVPMYVIHSRGDELMPLSAIEQAVATLRAHHAQVELVRLDTVTHEQTGAYVEPLRAAMPWIQRQWAHLD